jgi:hypothetical protein
MNMRSKRQLESLRNVRDWHLSMALQAQIGGRISEFEFHTRYYQLLSPAVDIAEAGDGASSVIAPSIAYEY